ncbi:T9SS type A sorting domain-containing protein [candidate division KSB1 bacterium]|nr:T9SS type A sorting domain-containing protein [candidate division KSB1 bacterium]
MKKPVYLYIILCVFLQQYAGYGENSNISLVRIKPGPGLAKNFQQFQDTDVDVTHFDAREGIVEGFADGITIKNLQKQGYIIEPLIADMTAFAAKLLNENYFSKFHSYPQMLEKMQDVVKNFPDIAMLQDIGDSYEKTAFSGGNDIWALKISDNVAVDEENEADVLFMAGIHAREVITSEVIMTFLDYLINNYNSDPYVTHLIDNREIWLLPCVNPDGHEYVFTGDINGGQDVNNPLTWRKNKQDNNRNGTFDPWFDGVDLNRNFGFMWGYDDEGSKSYMGHELYRGAEPFSEPETQAIREFAGQHNFVISLMYHSYGRLWLYPWEYTNEKLPEPALSTFTALADSCVKYNGYEPGNYSTGTIYKVNGGSDDWFFGELGIFSFSPEVGSRDQGFFWPDTSWLGILTGENLGPNLFMTWAAGEEPIVENKSFKNYETPVQYYAVTASIKLPILLTDPAPLDPAEFKVYYGYNQKDQFDSLLLAYLPDVDLYTAKIPGNDFSGTIYYYIQVKDSLGRTGCAPRGAPAELDSFVVMKPLHTLDESLLTANGFTLAQNYPNPFNSGTRISFELDANGFVNVTVYNRMGQKIRELADNTFTAGTHHLFWDGADETGKEVASGLYFYILKIGKQKAVKKMVYVR